jgi:hypothetical protein
MNLAFQRPKVCHRFVTMALAEHTQTVSAVADI